MNIKCPCCGFKTIDAEDEVIVEICEVCLWQYDEVAHEHPNDVIGANKISLNEAKMNFLKHGIAKLEYFGKGKNREPYDYER